MNNKVLFALLALSLTLFSACQSPSVPEPLLNQGDRPRVTRGNTSTEQIYPVLKMEQSGQAGEFKLRSQTSRYLSDDKTTLEIILTSSDLAFCKNESPELKAGEQEIRFTVKSKDGKTPVAKEELANNSRFEISGVYKTTAGEVKLDGASFESLKLTDLNNAIVRGILKINSAGLKLDGEFFTAICR
jgi:hypothetical protein